MTARKICLILQEELSDPGPCTAVGTRPKRVILESRHVIFPRFHITYVSFHRLNNKLLEVSKDGSGDNVGDLPMSQMGLTEMPAWQ